jgi:hypothetical protein
MFFTVRHALSSSPLWSALCTAIRVVELSTAEAKVSGSPVLDLVPLLQVRSQPLFDMMPEAFKSTAAIAIMKVAHPPSDGGVDFIHYPG